MIWRFSSPKELKDFIEELARELTKLKQYEISNELSKIVNSSYTTSSEQLGDLRLSLMKVKKEICARLDKEMQKDIHKTIISIGKTFGMQKNSLK